MSLGQCIEDYKGIISFFTIVLIRPKIKGSLHI